ncbi:MAG: hypothetical protein LQ352_002005 [Teloschistes flavicans]|nr:MAG: hypothetical protein LQ352_002005 [Teloschistes flavicans]
MTDRVHASSRSGQLDISSSLEPDTQYWYLASHNVDNTVTLQDIERARITQTFSIFDAIRNHLCDQASTNWRLRLLLQLSAIEVGTATVEAIRPELPRFIIITRQYFVSPVLTTALNQSSRANFAMGSSPGEYTTPPIRLLPSRSVNVGSKVLIIRPLYQDLRRAMELCAIALTGVFIGFLVGYVTGSVEVSIAVAAAWLQFAQLYQFSRVS